MPQAAPIQLDGQAVAGADRRAIVTLRAVPVGAVWSLTSVTVQSTSSALTTATLYRGIALTAPNVLDLTRLGGNGDTTDTVIELRAGEAMTIVWTNADPGSICTAIAYGTQRALS